MDRLKETNFSNVVLGAYVRLNGISGQKIDEPMGGKNKHGQSRNVSWVEAGNPKNLSGDDMVKTTYFSLKDEPEMRHQ